MERAERARPGAGGFTLLELIVAIAIFALISAMTYPSLIHILDMGDQVERQNARLAEVQKAIALIGRDLRQIVDRPVRDAYGGTLRAVAGGTGAIPPLELTRTGWRNPVGWNRSHLQRVAYLLVDGDLIRQSWTVLDRSTDSVAAEAVVLEGVEALELRFMGADRQWHEFWPPADAEGSVMPKAVEVILDLEDWGRINRIYRVAGP